MVRHPGLPCSCRGLFLCQPLGGHGVGPRLGPGRVVVPRAGPALVHDANPKHGLGRGVQSGGGLDFGEHNRLVAQGWTVATSAGGSAAWCGCRIVPAKKSCLTATRSTGRMPIACRGATTRIPERCKPRNSSMLCTPGIPKTVSSSYSRTSRSMIASPTRILSDEATN